MVLVGWLLASVLAPRSAFLERTAYALLFTLCAVPLVAYQVALAWPMFMSRGLLAGVSGVLLLGLAWPAWRQRQALIPPRPDAATLVLLVVALLLGSFSWLHHNHNELWLSLGSYLQTDKAKCFYMQTLSFVPELNVGRDPEMVRRAYGIISTPGNSLFTSAWMAVLGPRAFQFLHAGFHVLLFLFGCLLLRRWTASVLIAALVSAFAVLCPYSLWIEVLDRNVYVFALTPALLYTLEVHRERALLHGLLLGLVGGLGLRFLPLLFIVSAALLYLHWRQPWKRWVLLAVGVVLAFAFELPHLQHHGFESMGETQAVPGLFEFLRTPYMPHHNAVYYLLLTISWLGWVLTSLVVYGAGRTAREHPWRFGALLVMVLGPLVVLAGQRDWIEYDKTRIFIMSLWPLLCFLAVGLRGLVAKEGWGKRGMALAVSLVLVLAADFGLRGIDLPADESSLERKPVYQRESPEYIDFLRSEFAASGPLPQYGRMLDKLQWSRKHAEAQQVAHALVGGATSPWIDRWLEPSDLEAPEALGPPQGEEAWLDLAIDLERLVADPEAAVTSGASEGRVLVDYSDPKRIFDIHHKQVEVSWQDQPLPVTVLAQRPDIQVLRTLTLDLNAFVTLEEDELGFQKVNLVAHLVFPERKAQGIATAMTALPWMDDEPVVRLRIPADMRVVVRNWLVNPSEGVPHRIDGWEIRPDGDGGVSTRFFFGEPESYL